MVNGKKISFLVIALSALAGFLLYVFYGGSILRWFYHPQEPFESAHRLENVEKAGPVMSGEYEVVAGGLKIPWEVAFLPAGEMLVTERPGTLLRIGKHKQVYAIAGVAHRGEGGLLGLALHPDFPWNNFVYLYLTSQAGGALINRVERYRLQNDNLSEKKVIVDGIPGAVYHDGGRIEFGPDGMLYIATGDAGQSKLAQDKNSLAGKILRLRDDGSVPEDNPFGNAVWSYGHRNIQGLAWDDKGRLWATEHGRSGILSGLDELNHIEKGKNYGWPQIQGDETKEGMEAPFLNSGPDYTWAPADIEFVNGTLFFGGLRGEALYELNAGDTAPGLEINFLREFGRIRAVRLGPDGNLYITTSNTDGRGAERAGDDKIISLRFRPGK